MTKMDELSEYLDKAVEADQQLKETLREAHVVRKDIRDELKRFRDRISDILLNAVSEQVVLISDDMKADMQRQMEVVIAGIEDDWRAKLDLPPRKR